METLSRCACRAVLALAILHFHPVHAAEPPVDLVPLAPILGPGVAEQWVVKPAVFAVSAEPALVASSVAVRLEGKTVFAEPTEYFFAFRLRPARGRSSNVQLQMAVAPLADKKTQALSVSVSSQEAQTAVTYSFSVAGGAPQPAQAGTQHLVGVSELSLGWPEDLRRIVEAEQAAAPQPGALLHTVRCTVERGRFRTWLNGRYIGDLALESSLNPSGTMNLSLSPGAELVAVRTRPLLEPAARFEPLSLAGNLTGSTLGGQKIDQNSLPTPPRAEGWPSRPCEFEGHPV